MTFNSEQYVEHILESFFQGWNKEKIHMFSAGWCTSICHWKFNVCYLDTLQLSLLIEDYGCHVFIHM